MTLTELPPPSAAPSRPGPAGSPGERGPIPPEPGAPAARTPDSAPGPRDARRLVGLDIARGLAVLGMTAAHVATTSDDLSTTAGWLGLAHGRSSILFAVLAGISVGLMTGARRPYTGVRALQARTRILARSALLLAVGGALSLLGTPVALILAYYAVWFVLALPFARWPFRRLLVAGLLVGVVGAVATYYVSDLVERLRWSVGGDANGVLVQTMLGTYPGLMWMGFVLVGLALSRLDLGDRRTLATVLAGGVLAAVLGHGVAWASGVPADEMKGTGSSSYSGSAPGTMSGSASGSAPGTMSGSSVPGSYESAGMGDGAGWGGSGGSASFDEETMTETLPDGTVIDWTTQSATLPDGTVLEGEEFDDYFSTLGGGAGGLGGPTFDTSQRLPRPEAMLALAPHASTPTEFLGFGGTAVAVVALCCLLPLWARRLALPLAAVGAMSLTAYSAHVVLIYLWPDFFMNPGGGDNTPYAVMVSGLVAFALVWRFTVGRGPLEAVLRSVSMRAARVEGPAGS